MARTRRSLPSLALLLVSALMLGGSYAFGCGEEGAAAQTGSDSPDPATRSASAPTSAPTPEAASPRAAGPQRVIFDLAAHPERAETRWRVNEADALVIDYGTRAAAKYTLGGWRTRVGRDHDFGETSTTLLEGVTGLFLLPVEREGAHEIAFRARAFGDGRTTIYIDDETVHHARLPTRGDFEIVRFRVENLSAGEHTLRLRVPRTGRGDGVSAGVALDWMAITRGSLPESLAAIPTLVAGEGALGIPAQASVGWALSLPAGARLRAEASAPVRVRWLADGAEARDLGVHRGTIDLPLPDSSALGRLDLVAAAEPVRLGDPEVVAPGRTPAHRESAPPIRNVLVWLVDTVRADKLGPWNADTRVETPGLSRWSEGAGVFAAARTQENWTKPSVATLLSGLLPWQHTATSGEAVLPDRVELMSETLGEAGFRTGAFICNGYVSRAFGFRQGWRNGWRNYIREGRRTQARFVAADVLDWLDRNAAREGGEERQEQPFFLYVHTIDPHVPYMPPPETLAHYDPDPYSGPVDFSRDRTLLENIKVGRVRLNARDRRRLEALYDGEITYHDVHFASVMEGLERRGLADETMVVFTSDHGEEFFDHGSVGHGHSLYDELLHVPLAIRIPGVTDGRVEVSENVGLVDVLPTVLDALGREIPENLPGRSLLPLLEGHGESAPRPMVAGFMEGWRSVVYGHHKLIQRTANRWMLYDLASDPSEEHDISADHPLTVRALRGVLGLGLHGQTRPRVRRRTTTIDSELDAQLRALGYVGTQRR